MAACNDNKQLLKSRVLANADYDFKNQPPRFVINYKRTDPSHIISLGLEYIKSLSTTLAKLVVYCNRSDDEQLDAKLTIKYNPCVLGNNNKVSNVRYKNQNQNINITSQTQWVVRYNLPGTTYNTNNQRKVLTFYTATELIEFIFSKENGKVNLVELHAKGIKVSDDKEFMTLYYLPDA